MERLFIGFTTKQLAGLSKRPEDVPPVLWTLIQDLKKTSFNGHKWGPSGQGGYWIEWDPQTASYALYLPKKNDSGTRSPISNYESSGFRGADSVAAI